MYSGRYANPFAMPDWTRMYAPRCGRMQPGEGDPAEFMRQMTDAYNAVYQPMLDSLMQYWGGSTAAPWMQRSGAYAPGRRETRMRGSGLERGHRRERDCGCGCHRDDCHCRCCITDADLVIHARLGELRVVPLTIENPRRREREVRLELSNWTTRSGSPAEIAATLVPPTEFTLSPCSERDVVLGVHVRFREDAGDTPGTADREVDAEAGLTGLTSRIANDDTANRRLPDVEHCEVYYADLRAEGCDLRPIRIAVVVLPRDCSAHPIDCGCGCC